MSAPARLLAGPRRGLLGAVRPQLAVMSAQLVAGIGNLLFAVAVARVLDPGEYAGVVTVPGLVRAPARPVGGAQRGRGAVA